MTAPARPATDQPAADQHADQAHRARRRTLGAADPTACTTAPRRTPHWTGTLGGPAAPPLALGTNTLLEYLRLEQPVRIFDSRAGVAPTTVPKGRLLSRQRRTITALLGGAVPAAMAKTVHVELTVTNTSPSGTLTASQAGDRALQRPSLTWTTPGTHTIRTTVDVDALGRFTLEAAGQADVTVEVLGYYV